MKNSMRFYIINIKSSRDRRDVAADALSKHGVSKSDIEFIHPLMVRDYPSQDDWMEATGMTAFKKLKGSPPLVQISFLHAYIRCLTKIEAYIDTETIGIIIEDDCLINRDFSEIKGYIKTLKSISKTNFFFAQLSTWGLDDELLKGEHVKGTPFIRGAANGTWANALNRTAAATLKMRLQQEIPIRFSQHHVFAIDTYLKGFATAFRDFYTVAPDNTDLFIHTSAPSEYLTAGGELTRRNVYEAKQ